jgi:hypothetical protein
MTGRVLTIAACLLFLAPVTYHDHREYVDYVRNGRDEGVSFKGRLVGKAIETEPFPGVTQIVMTDLTFALPDDYASNWDALAGPACNTVYGTAAQVKLVTQSRYGPLAFAKCGGTGQYVWGAIIK